MSRYLLTPEAIEKMTGRDKVQAQQEVEDFKAVVATPQGRRFMKHLIFGRAKLDSWEGHGNSRDNFTLGRREVGSELKQDFLAVAPEQWFQMEAEYGRIYLEELKFQRSERDAKRKGQEES